MMPALLTSTSRRSNRFTAVSISAPTSCSSATSAFTASARRPSFSSAVTTSAAAGALA